MLVNQFPNCCGVYSYHSFYDNGNNDHCAKDFEEDFKDMDHGEIKKDKAFDLIILTEYQYEGAKTGLEKRGFKELGLRIRNENSGNYLVLFQRIIGKTRPPKPAPLKKPRFTEGKVKRNIKF